MLVHCFKFVTRIRLQLPVIPQLREMTVPLMTVPPFHHKPTVRCPLAATRTRIEVYRGIFNRIGVLTIALFARSSFGAQPTQLLFDCSIANVGQRRVVTAKLHRLHAPLFHFFSQLKLDRQQ